MTIPATLLLLGVHTEHTGFVAAGNTPIVITSDSTPDVNTGDTAVVTVTKTGGTGDIDFEIIGGADALLFTINDETGALAFTAASVDGTYEVIVRAFSDWGSATQTITVTVAAGGYHADAVHFDGSTWLGTASISSGSDVSTFSVSGWLKITAANLSGNDGVICCGDPDNNYTSFSDAYNNTLSAFITGSGVNCFCNSSGLLPGDAWFHYLFSCDAGFAEGSKKLKLYVNDVDVTSSISDIGGAFNNAMNGLPFYVGTDTFDDNLIGDAADIWISTQSLLVAGDIPEATRRLFISAGGKPVDPSGFPPGVVLFSGNAAAFVTNQGTGGAFTLTGSLTNASTSPSD